MNGGYSLNFAAGEFLGAGMISYLVETTKVIGTAFIGVSDSSDCEGSGFNRYPYSFTWVCIAPYLIFALLACVGMFSGLCDYEIYCD